METLIHQGGPRIVFVKKKVSITYDSQIKCRKRVIFEDYAEIHGLCTDGISFGNSVTIGRRVMICPSSYYGTDLGTGLIMGDNSTIGPYSDIGCSGKITIGSNVMIGPRCRLFAENHVFSEADATIKSQDVIQKGITIEDDCCIASNVIILDGVTIGRGSIIGTGTLVIKDVPPGSIIIDRRNKDTKPRGIEGL